MYIILSRGDLPIRRSDILEVAERGAKALRGLRVLVRTSYTENAIKIGEIIAQRFEVSSAVEPLLDPYVRILSIDMLIQLAAESEGDVLWCVSHAMELHEVPIELERQGWDVQFYTLDQRRAYLIDPSNKKLSVI